jgi:hypothetical protein
MKLSGRPLQPKISWSLLDWTTWWTRVILKPAATGIGKHDTDPAFNDDDAVGNKKKAKKTIAHQVTLPAKK